MRIRLIDIMKWPEKRKVVEMDVKNGKILVDNRIYNSKIDV